MVFWTQGDYNAIIVGWGRGADNLLYPQSASNTRTVGAEIGLVAANIIARGISDKYQLYCVGHSLGAHVCGHAGMKTKFGRVSGKVYSLFTICDTIFTNFIIQAICHINANKNNDQNEKKQKSFFYR